MISVGGGGIPVVADEKGELTGIAAVIDKDHACSLLANEIEAELLLITTAVEKVALDFGQPTPALARPDDARRGEAVPRRGHALPAGQHGAEDRGGRRRSSSAAAARAIITDPENVERALAGETGTHIVAD